jgi:predicted acylesterase/phospholipase RssA
MKIGLALSDGGVLGAAHVGVIEELEKSGVKPDFVCGSSAGALVGLAAVARSLDIYERELSRFEEKECDFCFRPKTLPFCWFDFAKIDLITQLGRKHAAGEIGNLRGRLNK